MSVKVPLKAPEENNSGKEAETKSLSENKSFLHTLLECSVPFASSFLLRLRKKRNKKSLLSDITCYICRMRSCHGEIKILQNLFSNN
mgnify:CR=1 FL=1